MVIMPPFTGHPLLAELETVIGLSESAFLACKQTDRDLKSAIEQVDPIKVAAEIEALLDKPNDMHARRLQLREDLIRYESLFLAFHETATAMTNCRLKLHDALTNIVRHVEQNRSGSSFASEGEALLWKAAVVRGTEQHRKQTPGFHSPNQDKYLRKQALQATREAFLELVAASAALKPTGTRKPLSYYKHAPRLHYTTADAVPSIPTERRTRSYEMREVSALTFKDTSRTEHPALRKLGELLASLRVALVQMSVAVANIKQNEKGRINEQQFAERLVQQVLMDEVQDGASEQVTAQSRARVSYEIARATLFCAIEAVEAIYCDIVDTLPPALAETAAIDRFVSTEQIVTVDVYETHRIALMNCLAADLMLRRTGRKLTEAVAEFNEDLSSGRAQSALCQQYHTCAASYRDPTSQPGYGS